MKLIIENLKARYYGQKFDIWHEKLIESRWYDWFIINDWYYNGSLYYGFKWFIFFYSYHNEWFKDIKYRFL